MGRMFTFGADLTRSEELIKRVTGNYLCQLEKKETKAMYFFP